MSNTSRALEGKTALVTGGGSGIGFACARHLLRDGAIVTIAGRSLEKLEHAASTLTAEVAHGAEVRVAVCDVTDEAMVEAAVRSASRSGRLDIAIANAGGGALGPISRTPLAEWRGTVEVNLTGVFLTIKHASQAMTGAGGAIVATSSIAGVLTHRFMAAYCASKAGVEMLVRCAADELGALGIRVNAVRPSLVPTDLAAPFAGDPAIVNDYLDQIPLARLGTVDDVAAAVRWLAGPESGWVTGQCVAIDGGHTLRRGPRIDSFVETYLGADALASVTPR
jgi:NAD(P)-dependent dehydrogenase (short-subunit alcohol dehydrogenase family)